MNRTTQLKSLLNSKEILHIMEAHNGISAKIAEQEGFQAIWGSGLSISASLGIRDANEASWSQLVDIIEFMVDATSIPLLVDGDCGFGNFNNTRRFVKKLEERGVAGVSLEDKTFPKNNSFANASHHLVSIEEFCGKIRACKDSLLDKDFCLIARTEAFIAGFGVEEALKRCESYARAGANAIFVHSKKSIPEEILAFCKDWSFACPIVIAPTNYYQTSLDIFAQAGISGIIWANQNIRASIYAMKKVCEALKSLNISKAHQNLVSIQEIFNLVDEQELREAEKKYDVN